MGPEGSATGPASRPAPPRPSLLGLVPLPPCPALPSQPASASSPIGLRCAVSQQAGGGTLFEAVRQWSSPRRCSASSCPRPTPAGLLKKYVKWPQSPGLGESAEDSELGWVSRFLFVSTVRSGSPSWH